MTNTAGYTPHCRPFWCRARATRVAAIYRAEELRDRRHAKPAHRAFANSYFPAAAAIYSFCKTLLLSTGTANRKAALYGTGHGVPYNSISTSPSC